MVTSTATAVNSTVTAVNSAATAVNSIVSAHIGKYVGSRPDLPSRSPNELHIFLRPTVECHVDKGSEVGNKSSSTI